MARAQIGELLVRAKAVTPADVEEAIGWQVLYGGRIGTNLLELGLVDEKILAETLGKQYGCEWHFGEIEITESMVQAIPGVIARRADVVPWRIEGKRLKVLCACPTDNMALFDEMGFRLGKIIKPVVVPEFRLHQVLRRYFDSPRQMRALDFGQKPKSTRQQQAEKKAEAAEAEKAVDLMDDESFAAIYKEAMGGRGAADTAPPRAMTGEFETNAAPFMAPSAEQQARAIDLPPPLQSSPPTGWTSAPPPPPSPAARSNPPIVPGPPPGWAPAARPSAPPTPPPVMKPLVPKTFVPPPAAAWPPVATPAVPPPPPAWPPVATPAAPPPAAAWPPAAPVAPISLPPPLAATPAPASTPAPTPAPIAAKAAPPPVVEAAEAKTELEFAPIELKPAAKAEPPPPKEAEPEPEEQILDAELIEDPETDSAGTETIQPADWAAALQGLGLGAGGEEPPPPPPRDMSPLSFKEALAEVGTASDRDAVARTVLRYARSKALRAVLLSVQGDVALGWDAAGDTLDQDVARRIAFPLSVPSAFRLVRESRSHYIGPLGKDPGNVRFLKLAGKQWPSSAVLLPVLFHGKVVYILYVDNGHKKHVDADVGELLILSQNISRSMEQMVAQKQKPKAE